MGDVKSVLHSGVSTVKFQFTLVYLCTVEGGGIGGVAVKCLDITKNSYCEGSVVVCN